MDNLSAKTTAFATLVGTGELATIDCLELSGLTNRVAEMVERGKQAKQERQEEAIELAKKSAEASGEGDSSTSSKNGANKTAEIEKAASGNSDNKNE